MSQPRRKVSAPSGPVSSVLGLFHLQKATPPTSEAAAASSSSSLSTSPAGGRRFGRRSDACQLRQPRLPEAADDALSASSSENEEGDAECGGCSGSGDKRSRRLLVKPPIHRSQSTGDSRAAAAAAAAGGDHVIAPAAAHEHFLQKTRPRRHPDGDRSRDSGGGGGGVYEGGDESRELREHRLSSGDLRKKKKSISEKLSFLSWRVQGADSTASSAIRPSHEQVHRWSSSFDSLLNDKYGLALFRAFLKTEYSDENIEFWVACEEYRALSGPKKQAVKAQKIYSEFVAFQAPREVNLDSSTRLATINAMGSADSHLFEQAQKRIQALMEKDSYQRFLRSEVYQAHLRGSCSRHREAVAARASDQHHLHHADKLD